MATSTPRMQQLRKLLEKEPKDPFLLYGIALEFKKVRDLPAAIEHLDRVIALDPGYCYAYHQKGLAYEEAGDAEAARRAYRDGIEAARKKGDLHAAQEIEGALNTIGQ